jgi:tetratricopeptide (TPR) repeat protein
MLTKKQAPKLNQTQDMDTLNDLHAPVYQKEDKSSFPEFKGFSLFGDYKSSPWTRSAEIKTPEKAIPFSSHFGFPSVLEEEPQHSKGDLNDYLSSPFLEEMDLWTSPISLFKNSSNPIPNINSSSTLQPTAPSFVPVYKPTIPTHLTGEALVSDFTERIKDMEDYDKISKLAEAYLLITSKTHQYKIFLDMAEKAKKLGQVIEAANWYHRANQSKPNQPQGWLDAMKLEEDSGRMEECEQVLLAGIHHCPQNEPLLIKGLKFFEQLGNLAMARSLLSKVKTFPIEKSWKIILEGAQMEARAGHLETCRKLYEYLMKEAPSHGPIYSESFKMEYNYENYEVALEIVEKGLVHLPKYGPLWFCLFQVVEKLNKPMAECISKSITSISKELVWKVYFEYAQIKERNGDISGARDAYVESAIHSIPTLRWKVWLAGSRLELNHGKLGTCHYLLNRALDEVPNKTRASVLIECARMEEYLGKLDLARNYIKKAQKEAKHEWKVFLEGILLEMRNGQIERAIKEAREALKIHKRTGRLWAMLIQLLYIEGEEAQMRVFHEALLEVPKSGEVWCEGARIRMNPLYNKFDLAKAKKYLTFAINFTPQYGDSFIEYLKLQLLTRGSFSDTKWIKFEQKCIHADPNYGPLWFHCKTSPLDSTRSILKRAKHLLFLDLSLHRSVYQERMFKKSEEQSRIPNYLTGLPYLCILLNTSKLEESARRRLIFGVSDHVL